MKKDFSYWIIPVYKNKEWDCEFLIIDQKTNNGSFWWFPKWHPEEWEDWISAAKREFEEEVGINEFEIKKDKNFEVSYMFKDKWQKITKTVKYRIAIVWNKNVKIQTKELNGYKRVDFDTAIKKLSHENTRNILRKAVKEI